MAAVNLYIMVFGITALVIADPLYSQGNRKELDQSRCLATAYSTEESRLQNHTLTILVDDYKKTKNWTVLASKLKCELNTSSPAYIEALNMSADEQYPLKQMSRSASYLNLLTALLDAGLGPDTAAGPDNWTMLHFTAEHGTLLVAKVLLVHGANPNARTSMQDTPVIIAAWRNHLPLVKALHKHGADLNSQNNDGRTALHRAAYWGNTDVVKYLVDSGANTTVTTKLGNTPLDDARNRDYTEIIEILSSQNSTEC